MDRDWVIEARRLYKEYEKSAKDSTKPATISLAAAGSAVAFLKLLDTFGHSVN